MNKKQVLETLGLPDAFEGFQQVPNTKLVGWNGDTAVFGKLVREVKPKTIIEVGSWMGQSSCNFGRNVKANNLDTAVICVDTWLGSVEHWQDPAIKPMLELENGRPTFYKRFLTNAINEGVSDVIVPLSLPSLIAGNYLKANKITADLIYIDGSHDQKDVYNDLELYWQLLAPGGLCFGDDAPWISVITAVKAFSAEVGVPTAVQGINWFLRKRLE